MCIIKSYIVIFLWCGFFLYVINRCSLFVYYQVFWQVVQISCDIVDVVICKWFGLVGYDGVVVVIYGGVVLVVGCQGMFEVVCMLVGQFWVVWIDG